jgi:hypothetical protein
LDFNTEWWWNPEAPKPKKISYDFLLATRFEEREKESAINI